MRSVETAVITERHESRAPFPLTPTVVQISAYLAHSSLYLRAGNRHACLICVLGKQAAKSASCKWKKRKQTTVKILIF